MVEEKDFEIGDVESFSSGKDQNYSRSASIMRQTNKAQDDLSKEMKPSFLEIRRDKFGNEIKTLSDDSRKRACSSVQTLKNTLQCDFDKECDDEIKAIEKAIADRKVTLLKLEGEEWKVLSVSIRSKLTRDGKGYMPGLFHRDKKFSEMFIEFSLDKHREIFESLIRLSKRLDFFRAESFEG